MNIETLKKDVERQEKELSVLKGRIEALANKTTEFEKGKWYYGETSNASIPFLVRFMSMDGNTVIGNYMSKSHANFNEQNRACSQGEIKRPATTEEIQSALIKEADRRGFKEGARVYDANEGEIYSESLTELLSWEYENNSDRLLYWYVDNNGIRCFWPIYAKGIWDEIVKEPAIKVGDQEVKFFANCIKVGCTTVSNEILEKIYNKQFKK